MHRFARPFAVLLVALATAWAAPAALAQAWPAKPVRVIVPYLPGGGVDPVARLVGQKLAEKWGQAVVVENRAGASGSIGANDVAKSPPDGYTVLMSATAEVAINEFFMTNMAYSPERDLRPVTLLVRLPFALVTQPTRPYADMAQLVAYARAHPGQVSYASSGPGTPQHLAGVMIEQLAGVSLLHVPFKGVAQAMADLLGGQVDIGFAGLPTALQQIRAGKLRALGVSSTSPAAAAPEIPPIARTPGLEHFELIQWFGVFVPAKTPDAVVQRLQHDIAEVLMEADVGKTLRQQGAEPSGMPTAEFEKFVAEQREKFRGIVKAADIRQ